MSDNMTLKDLRECRGLTQKDVADSLYVTVMCYNNWENGKRQIPFASLDRLARVLGVSVPVLSWVLLGRMPKLDPSGYVAVPAGEVQADDLFGLPVMCRPCYLMTMEEFVRHEMRRESITSNENVLLAVWHDEVFAGFKSSVKYIGS